MGLEGWVGYTMYYEAQVDLATVSSDGMWKYLWTELNWTEVYYNLAVKDRTAAYNS